MIKTMIRTACEIFLVIILTGCVTRSTGNISGTDTVTVANERNIRLIFAGDVMGHSTQVRGAWHDGGDSCYNFMPTFQWVKSYISSADLAIANLELTFAGEPYTGYPTFSCPVALAEALQDTGFDLLLTANNHSLDRGSKGMLQTINVLDNLDITHTGSFKDSVSREVNYPLIIEKNGFRLAFLNYTYGTNGFMPTPPFIVNYLDTTKITDDLERCRAMNADYIISCVHWGDEYMNYENETQRELAHFLARNGCNLIVGSHPHVVQPVQQIEGYAGDSVLVAYSLGNFVSNQRWRYSDGGIMLEVNLTQTDSTVTLQSYSVEPFWVVRYPDQYVQVYRLIMIDDYINHPDRFTIVTPEDDSKLWQFYNDTKEIIPVIHTNAFRSVNN